jgi:hypothetical protein
MLVLVAKSAADERRDTRISFVRERHVPFCSNCGTPIFFERQGQPEWCGVIAGTLNDQSQFAPSMHVWSSRMVRWLHLADDLPRHAEFPPSG